MSSEPLLEDDDDRMAETLESLALVRRVQAGDRQAYLLLLERYYSLVLAIVRRRLGTRLRRTLESGDVVQEVMEHALRGWSRFEIRSRRTFVALLAAIVENRIRAIAHSQEAQKRDPGRLLGLDTLGAESGAGSGGLDPSDPAPAPGEILLERERAAALRECMERLPEHYLRVIRLRHVSELPWAEVARVLGRPSPDAARMLYAKAILELRGELERRSALSRARPRDAETPIP